MIKISENDPILKGDIGIPDNFEIQLFVVFFDVFLLLIIFVLLSVIIYKITKVLKIKNDVEKKKLKKSIFIYGLIILILVLIILLSSLYISIF